MAVFFVSPSAHALESEEVKFSASVGVEVHPLADHGPFEIWWGTDGNLTQNYFYYNQVGSGYTTPQRFIQLSEIPTQISVKVEAPWMDRAFVDFDPPPGYTLYVDGLDARGFQVMQVGEVVTKTLILKKNGTGGPVGVDSGFRVSPMQSIQWWVNVGMLPSGAPAGAISAYLAAGYPVSRASLAYASFEPSVDGIYENDGKKLRQILAPQAFIDVTDITEGVQLAFYTRDLVAPQKVGGLYVLANAQSAPFVRYRLFRDPETGQLIVQRIAGGRTDTTTATRDGNITSIDYSGLRTVTNESWTSISYPTGTHVQRLKALSPSGAVAAEILKTYQLFPWGWEVIQKVDDPEGTADTTTYTYYNGSTADGGYARLASTTYPDGNWAKYTYYNSIVAGTQKDGMLKSEFSPWLDGNGVTPGTANENNCVVTTYDYVPNREGYYVLESSRQVKVNGVQTGNSATTYDLYNPVNNASLFTQTKTHSANTSTTYLSTNKSYDPIYGSWRSSLPHSSTSADGVRTSYAYQRGTYDSSSGIFTANSSGHCIKAVALRGFSAAAPGATLATTPIAGETIEPVYMVPYQSIQSVTYQQNGLVLRDETYAYTATGFYLMNWVNHTYNEWGALVSSSSSDNTAYSAIYENGLKVSETDAAGTTTQYTYDALRRVSTVTKTPGPGLADNSYIPTNNIVTTYTYDADGRVLTQTTTGGSLTLASSSTYTVGGKLSTTVAPGGYTTTYADSPATRTMTVTLPGGGTQITSRYLDGRTKSVTGTAQIDSFFDYAVDGSTGFFSTTIRVGSTTSTARTLSKNDWLGRTILTKSPNTLGGDIEVAYEYNTLGQLKASNPTGQPATLYTYSLFGEREVTALDVNQNNVIDYDGTDRIGLTETEFSYVDSAWWKSTLSSVYATAGNGSPTLVGTTDVRLSNFPAGVIVETRGTDIHGNVTTSQTAVNRASRLVTTTISTTGITPTAQKIAYNGYPSSDTGVAGSTTTYGYDALGRPNRLRDGRGAVVLTSYNTGSSLVEGTWFEGGAWIAQNTYDAAGRLSVSTDALGHTTTYTYNTRGQTTAIGGTAATPIGYEFDSLGRMSAFTTYGNAGDARTALSYHGDLPLLAGKTDAGNKIVSRTYDALNRPATITDARGVVTTFGYSAATGDLLTKTYSDDPTNTPGVTFTYGRRGEAASVTDATGTRTFAYNAQLQQTSETLPAFFGVNRILSGTYATSGMIGRATGWRLGTSANPAADQSTGYTYFTDGRLNEITAQGSGHSAQTFGYTYTSGADSLVAGVTHAASSYAQQRTYHLNYGGVEDIKTSIGSTVKTRYAYTFSNRGERSQVTQSGAAFADYDANVKYQYGYDGRGQLTAAIGSLGETGMSGRQFAFAYDEAGNRTSANRTGLTDLREDYTVNNLNQITAKENTSLSVQGVAAAGANVVVNNQEASRAGRYWASEIILPNENGPASGTVAVHAAIPGTGGAADQVTSLTKPAYLPAASQTLNYDDAGNLTGDGDWTYTWDAENRLISMTTAVSALAAGQPFTTLQFSYDYLGRRVKKRTDISGAQTERRYVYSGWSLAAETDASGTIQRHFFWGLDIAGSPTAAGGVGGLLLIQDNGQNYLPAYDGNGNLTALLYAVGGGFAALYEYGPFGEILRSTGAYAAANPVRFSTKWQDEETGLLYYGLRYYHSTLGRFINRDPIEEAGGLNLYGFCGNDGVNRWDYLGLDALSPPPGATYESGNDGGMMITFQNGGQAYVYKDGTVFISPPSNNGGTWVSAGNVNDLLKRSNSQTNGTAVHPDLEAWIHESIEKGSGNPIETDFTRTDMNPQPTPAEIRVLERQGAKANRAVDYKQQIGAPNSGDSNPSLAGGIGDSFGRGALFGSRTTVTQDSGEPTTLPDGTVLLPAVRVSISRLTHIDYIHADGYAFYGSMLSMLGVPVLGDLANAQYAGIYGNTGDRNMALGMAVVGGALTFVPGGKGAAPIAGKITGYTRHGLNQAISRDGVGVSARAILDAVRNPLSTIAQNGGKLKYVGQEATVILNQDGKVISTYATQGSGVRLLSP